MTRNENILIIGIAGGTGSGKTTLARHIADAFGDRVAVITHTAIIAHKMTRRTRSVACKTTTIPTRSRLSFCAITCSFCAKDKP